MTRSLPSASMPGSCRALLLAAALACGAAHAGAQGLLLTPTARPEAAQPGVASEPCAAGKAGTRLNERMAANNARNLGEDDLLPEMPVWLLQQGRCIAMAGGTLSGAVSQSERLQAGLIGPNLLHIDRCQAIALTNAEAPPVVTPHSAPTYGLSMKSSLRVSHRFMRISQAWVERAQGGSVSSSSLALGPAYALWPRHLLHTSHTKSQSEKCGSQTSFALPRELSLASPALNSVEQALDSSCGAVALKVIAHPDAGLPRLSRGPCSQSGWSESREGKSGQSLCTWHCQGNDETERTKV